MIYPQPRPLSQLEFFLISNEPFKLPENMMSQNCWLSWNSKNIDVTQCWESLVKPQYSQHFLNHRHVLWPPEQDSSVQSESNPDSLLPTFLQWAFFFRFQIQFPWPSTPMASSCSVGHSGLLKNHWLSSVSGTSKMATSLLNYRTDIQTEFLL